MPHWAEISENNTVLRVTYGEGTDEETYQWLIDNVGGTWVRTYYDTPGQTYAGVGYIYDPGAKNFSAPSTPSAPDLSAQRPNPAEPLAETPLEPTPETDTKAQVSDPAPAPDPAPQNEETL